MLILVRDLDFGVVFIRLNSQHNPLYIFLMRVVLGHTQIGHVQDKYPNYIISLASIIVFCDMTNFNLILNFYYLICIYFNFITKLISEISQTKPE